MKEANELNSFTLRAVFEKTPAPNRTYYTFTGAADALLDSITGIGECKAYITDSEGEYAVTNDGNVNVTMNGQYCYLESLNGSYVYFPVRGGLPDGDYEVRIEFRKKNGSGQWEPRLSTYTAQLRIDNQTNSFT